MSTSPKSTLDELANAVETTERAYVIAQKAASELNSRKSGAAALKAHKAMVAAKAAYANARKADALPLTAAEAWAEADRLHGVLDVARADKDEASRKFRQAYEIAQATGPRPAKVSS